MVSGAGNRSKGSSRRDHRGDDRRRSPRQDADRVEAQTHQHNVRAERQYTVLVKNFTSDHARAPLAAPSTPALTDA